VTAAAPGGGRASPRRDHPDWRGASSYRGQGVTEVTIVVGYTPTPTGREEQARQVSVSSTVRSRSVGCGSRPDRPCTLTRTASSSCVGSGDQLRDQVRRVDVQCHPAELQPL